MLSAPMVCDAHRFTTIVVFFAGTMSVLTIVVQGTTMPFVLNWLGITRKTPVQIQHLLLAAREVEEYADRKLSYLRVIISIMLCCLSGTDRFTWWSFGLSRQD
jgi:hypothetical protein